MKLNRRLLGGTGLVIAVIAATGAIARGGSPKDVGTREPAVAGRFYPADPAKLRGAVEAFLHDALPARDERPIAIVVPHAGYVFSGQIAGDAWKQAMGRGYDLVVILGTNHTTAEFRGVSVFTGAGLRTPLGVASTDRAVAASLVAADRDFGYRPEVHREEHSVEVQVPFAQVALPGVKVVEAVVGTTDADLCARFGRELARAVRGRRALIVASSDLSHYPNHDDAVAADSVTLAAIAGLDPGAVRGVIAREMRSGKPGLVTCACGEGPILAAMIAARELGATHGVVVSRANSGETALGDGDRVVGYGAVVLCGGPGAADTRALEHPAVGAGSPAGTAPGADRSGQLDPDDRRALLTLARETIRRFLTTETLPLARGLPAHLQRKQGAFVTIEKNGELRGCIGHMAEDRPLAEVVGAMVYQAAFGDPRFSPLEEDEYAAISIEISVLTPMAPIPGPDRIVVGRDGVMLRKGGRSAVFLPQVAPEQGWGRDELLDNLCRKAGMPADCWRERADLFTFQAIVFKEADLAPPAEARRP
jgi:hypothetical protein